MRAAFFFFFIFFIFFPLHFVFADAPKKLFFFRVTTTAFVAHGVTARPDIHPAFYSELPTNFATGCDWLAVALNSGDDAQVSFFFFERGVARRR